MNPNGMRHAFDQCSLSDVVETAFEHVDVETDNLRIAILDSAGLSSNEDGCCGQLIGVYPSRASHEWSIWKLLAI